MASRNASSTTAPVPWHGWYRSEKVFGDKFAILTADVTGNGNTVTLFRVPKGFTATGFRVDATSLDSNVSPTVTLSLGDSGSGTRFMNAGTLAQAGGTVSGFTASTGTTVSPGLFYRFSADTDIVATFTTGAATARAGTLNVVMNGFIDN